MEPLQGDSLYHSVRRYTWYSFIWLQKDKRLSQILEPFSGFEPDAPQFGVQHPNH